MAFIGIKIIGNVGDILSNIDVPGIKENKSEYHITLLYFQKNWPISEAAKTLEATFNVVSETKPFNCKINKISCFPKRENEPVAIVAKIESENLHNLRGSLFEEFEKFNINFSKTFKDFNPHITLSYGDNEINDININLIEFQVEEIILWAGDHGNDRVFITFPLEAQQSLELKQNNLSNKLANNPNVDHFIQSQERRKKDR